MSWERKCMGATRDNLMIICVFAIYWIYLMNGCGTSGKNFDTDGSYFMTFGNKRVENGCQVKIKGLKIK